MFLAIHLKGNTVICVAGIIFNLLLAIIIIRSPTNILKKVRYEIFAPLRNSNFNEAPENFKTIRKTKELKAFEDSEHFIKIWGRQVCRKSVDMLYKMRPILWFGLTVDLILSTLNLIAAPVSLLILNLQCFIFSLPMRATAERLQSPTDLSLNKQGLQMV